MTASFLRAVFEMFSISVFCGLSQSHFRLRGSERISEWGCIWASISIGTYQGNLFCREHDRGQHSSLRLRNSEFKSTAKYGALTKDRGEYSNYATARRSRQSARNGDSRLDNTAAATVTMTAIALAMTSPLRLSAARPNDK